MLLSPVRTVAPTAQLVTVSEAKEHLRLYHDDDNALIQRYIDSAVQALDGWSGTLGRCLLTQTWRQDYAGFPITGALMPLPMPGVQSATVAYYDADNVSQTFAASNWHLVNMHQGAAILLEESTSWPSTYTRPDAVQVTMVMGYGATADTVPEPIRSAAIIMVQRQFEGAHTEDDRAVQALLAPYRRVKI